MSDELEKRFARLHRGAQQRERERATLAPDEGAHAALVGRQTLVDADPASILDVGKQSLVEREWMSGSPSSPTGTPGKATLSETSNDPRRIAASGVDGPGTRLPYLDRIQASFGRHDVTGVRAHVGGAAGGAARQLGARAFAFGEHIAFDGAPDLHTAAHEAAHHVQQRAGVALKGVIDDGGDEYEQHADDVADAVVRGESAEPLLDRMAGRGASATPASPAVVQRKTGATRSTPATGEKSAAQGEATRGGVAASLMAELAAVLDAEDTRGQAARVRRLVALCRSIAAPLREELAARFAKPAKDDLLAARVHGRLHPKTVTKLINALRGRPVAIAGATSALTRAVLDVEPGAVITLDRSLGPTAHVRVTPRAAEPPSVEGPPVALRWVHQPITGDAEARAPEVEAGGWLAANTQGDPFVFQVRSPGTHRVQCEVSEGGIVVAVLETAVEVRETHRSATSAYRTGPHPDDPGWRALDDGVQVQRGEDLAAAMSVPGDSLRASYDAKHGQLATDAMLSPEQRAVLADEVSVLELAATERGEVLSMPAPPPDAATVEVLGHVLADDPVYLRSFLEGIYASSNASTVGELIEDIGEELARPAPNDAEDPGERLGLRGRIMPILHAQWATLRGELDQFVDEFYWRAHNAFAHKLQESEAIASSEMERYTGVSFQGQPMNPAPPDPAVEAPKLARAAAELRASQRQLNDIRMRYYYALGEKRALDEPGLLERLWPGKPEPKPAAEQAREDGKRAELEALIASLNRMIQAAKTEHSQRVILATAEFPVLASYKREAGEHVEVDLDGIARITGGNVGTEVKARAMNTWHNILRTRAALASGDLDVWKQPRVLDLARAEMPIARGSARDRAIANAIAAAHGASWEQWALIAMTFALSVAAAIPTGGSSIAAGIAASAEVLTVASSIYTALDTLETYQIEKAAAGTDFDKAKAISASEPSLLWVAIDIVAVGLDIKSMVTTFRTIRTAWASAKAGGAVDEALAVIQAEHHAGRLSAEAATRLEGELGGRAAGVHDHLAQRVADDMVEDGADALDAARTAPARRVTDDVESIDDALAERRLAGPARRTETRARVRVEDVASYERKLGVPVATNASLEDGVRVHFIEAKNGDLLVTRVEVGPLALVDDVLAHRRTIARLTRYNGVVGELRRLWDELVVFLGGRIHENPFRNPPFGPGSRAFASFEELHKLEELLRVRRAAWTPDAIHADLIDDEIRHLQGELRRHAEVVRDAKQTLQQVPGGGFIERPAVGQRTQEATAAGWKLPAEHPEDYYYRASDATPGVYELALKPSASKELPSLHAEFEIVGGVPRPTGKIVPRAERVRAARVFSELDSPDQVLKGLRESRSTSAYLDMLTKTNERVAGAAPLATNAEIAEAIAEIRAAKASLHEDELRHELKERFRKRVEDFINDDRLDNAASYQRMRQTLDGLGVSDKGNVTEVWYQRRYAKHAERHTPIGVQRTDAATGDAWLEDRKIDLFDGKTATEVKSGAGPLGQEGKDQFLAYVQMVEGRQHALYGGKRRRVEALKYVFTDAAGARKNLPWMAKILQRREIDFVIEVFDETGQHVSLRSVDALQSFAKGAAP